MKRILRALFCVVFIFLSLDVRALPPGFGELLYIHNDALGTPQAMTDESGNVVWTAETDPFGGTKFDEDPDGDGKKIELNVRFPGQYYDKETGLHYNYSRYYDPQTGRYLTSDPIGLEGGLNPYGYALGNPIINIDPDGLRPTKNPKGPDGKPIEHGCVKTCVTNYIGSGILAAGAGLGFSAITAGSVVGSVTGAVGSSASSAYSAFGLGDCLDQCNKEEGLCK